MPSPSASSAWSFWGLDQRLSASPTRSWRPWSTRAAAWPRRGRRSGRLTAAAWCIAGEPIWNAKQVYTHPVEQVGAWGHADLARIPLLEVVQQVRPTALLGTAAQPGAFNEAVVRAMAAHPPRPVIFPLSNPTSKSEARPADLLAWTDGRALAATGSPFAPVTINGRSVPVGQCTNAFPGVGQGMPASEARRVTDGMFIAAARVLSEGAPIRRDPGLALYPVLEDVRKASRNVAHAVARAAMAEGKAPVIADDELTRRIESAMWQPVYRPYRRVAAAPGEARDEQGPWEGKGLPPS
ncbi:MAG: malic enzyme-like NAD(P)-binding protein [Oscillochloridaceae bacterium]|nr:hypothetical protein [Chloroflexaceae bacterium]MDW8390762.1 malic enzyme-like NAD(P)-binding protein [Oscillochloridaceae bacterium]